MYEKSTIGAWFDTHPRSREMLGVLLSNSYDKYGEPAATYNGPGGQDMFARLKQSKMLYWQKRWINGVPVWYVRLNDYGKRWARDYLQS
jgi:hypothetical protein